MAVGSIGTICVVILVDKKPAEAGVLQLTLEEREVELAERRLTLEKRKHALERDRAYAIEFDEIPKP